MRLPAYKANVRAALGDLGGCVAALRNELNLTQEELAARSGIDYKRVQTIERGKANITIGTLVRIAEALDVPLARLVSGRPPKRRS